MIEVQIFGALWEHLEHKMELDLEGKDCAVADLLARLRIDPAEVGIVTVAGRQSRMDDPVSENSRVCIFPPMFGG